MFADLVLEGGGVKGIALVGAIGVLEQRGGSAAPSAAEPKRSATQVARPQRRAGFTARHCIAENSAQVIQHRRDRWRTVDLDLSDIDRIIGPVCLGTNGPGGPPAVRRTLGGLRLSKGKGTAASMKTRKQPRGAWTTVLRRRPVRVVDVRAEGGYTEDSEGACCECGKDPDLNYREVSPERWRSASRPMSSTSGGIQSQRITKGVGTARMAWRCRQWQGS